MIQPWKFVTVNRNSESHACGRWCFLRDQYSPPHFLRLLDPHFLRLLDPHSLRLLDHHSLRLLDDHSLRLLDHHSLRLLDHHSLRLLDPHSLRLLDHHSLRLLDHHSLRLPLGSAPGSVSVITELPLLLPLCPFDPGHFTALLSIVRYQLSFIGEL